MMILSLPCLDEALEMPHIEHSNLNALQQSLPYLHK